MPLALTGSLTAVQFCYPAELPLTLNKLKRFETGSLLYFFDLNQAFVNRAFQAVNTYMISGFYP